MIRVKKKGSIRIISAEDFRRDFGVLYLGGMKPNADLTKEFLEACSRYGVDAENKMGRELAQAYRDQLDSRVAVPAFIAKISDDVGHGLFAAHDLEPDALIGEYTGTLTTDWKPLDQGGILKPYLFKYPFESAVAIDAQNEGNELRFMNHSKKQNVGRRYVYHRGILHAIFVAETRIKAGSQLLFEYAAGFWGASAPVEIRP